MNSKNAKDLKRSEVQPAKSGGKKGNHGKRQISQIPGLSQVITVTDEKNFGKRVGVLDSDSEYTKLAKQGGHKGLLYFDDSIDPKPNTFDSAEVLADGPIESLGNVNVICTKERKSPTTPSQRPLPPFWTDNMSTWERDGGSPRKEKNKKVPDKESVQSQTSPPNNGGSKFRRTVSSKKSSPVNMSKLLSFGYVDEDKASANETESSAT
ncbi:uncharacterized protein C7orf57 homolog isoform X2 [Corythoichthys intestinalis]|nr:uncharacterized protein C7orf57 homolog isoform X2 [Corythoichthys intestinalis]XP_057717030.1 uncharacterized protein C7orf57 homolog isoform X2 [Corythoichthys intestinalis]